MTQACFKNNENNESAKIKEVDKSSIASGDLVTLTQGSSNHDGKRPAPGRVAEKGKGNKAECPHHWQQAAINTHSSSILRMQRVISNNSAQYTSTAMAC